MMVSEDLADNFKEGLTTPTGNLGLKTSVEGIRNVFFGSAASSSNRQFPVFRGSGSDPAAESAS